MPHHRRDPHAEFDCQVEIDFAGVRYHSHTTLGRLPQAGAQERIWSLIADDCREAFKGWHRLAMGKDIDWSLSPYWRAEDHYVGDLDPKKGGHVSLSLYVLSRRHEKVVLQLPPVREAPTVGRIRTWLPSATIQKLWDTVAKVREFTARKAARS